DHLLHLPSFPTRRSSDLMNSTPQCLAGNNFVFTNTSNINSGTLTWLWDFADGGGSTMSNPTHVYLAAGTYLVKLTATSKHELDRSEEHTSELQSLRHLVC